MRALLAALAESVTDSLRRTAGRIALKVVLALVGAAFALVGLGFVIAGIFIAIDRALGPLAASFILAALFLLIAVILFAVAGGGRAARPGPPPPPPRRGDEGLGMGAVSAAYAVGFARGLLRRRRRQEPPG